MLENAIRALQFADVNEDLGDIGSGGEMLDKGPTNGAAGPPQGNTPTRSHTRRGRAGRRRHARCRAVAGLIWQLNF